jgi:hypothetical protein
MILGHANDGPRDLTGTSRDGVGPLPHEGAASAVNLLRSPGRETTTDGDVHWDRRQRGLGQKCTSGGRKEATLKGGQNTRYPIPESRPEVPEPELPDHNFG